MVDKIPQTILDYVVSQIDKLEEASRLIVVFDPIRYLDLQNIFETETLGESWQVRHYDGNDLAFRKSRMENPAKRELVWITNPPGGDTTSPHKIDLSSLMDIWRRADAFIDASLPGVLKKLVPTETWPEIPLWEYVDVLGQNLSNTVNGRNAIRRYLDKNAALDSSAIRAIALHCLNPSIQAHRFLFHVDTPVGVLGHYLELLWSNDWGSQGREWLLQQAQQAPRFSVEEIYTWLDISSADLALYLYLRQLLGKLNVPNVSNQLRGLGLVDADPDALELQAGYILARWEREDAKWEKIIKQAEESLSIDDARRIASLVKIENPEMALDLLQKINAPAIMSVFINEFIRSGLETSQFELITPLWIEKRPASIDNLTTTPYNEPCLAAADILDEIAFVDARRFLKLPTSIDLSILLDWYVENHLYDLEYAHVRARSKLLALNDEYLRSELKKYLNQQYAELRTYLDKLDYALAGIISKDWPGYYGHPRLSTNVLWDTVKKKRFKPTPKSRLWIIVFDGMRWDTWARHVRPKLQQIFEIIEEKPYLSLLPSWTMIARTGLLAGKQPRGWKNYSEKFTRDQGELISRLFGISRSEKNNKLLFYTGMESDRKVNEVMGDKDYLYNVLIYNISDDNLHGMKGNLLELNKVVDTLLESILQVLNNLVSQDDLLVFSSDHGFMELDESDAIVVQDDKLLKIQVNEGSHPVRYRYMTTHQVPEEIGRRYRDGFLKIEYPGLFDKYTVVVGKHWFKRAGVRSPGDRYAHGGLSFSEMTVPGALAKRILEKSLKPDLELHPRELVVLEEEIAGVDIRLFNRGNVPIQGRLTVQDEPIGETVEYRIDLAPGNDFTVSYQIVGKYRKRINGEDKSTHFIKVLLIYKDLDGKEISTKPRRIPVTVQPRTDKVEIEFGGLDDIDI